MNKDIKIIVESYFDSTQQMNQSIKNMHKIQQAEEKTRDERRAFICSVLGKVTWNKFENGGSFAPIPLNAIKLSKKDFDNLNNTLSEEENTYKLVEELQKIYYKNDFILTSVSGDGAEILKTDLVFSTPANVIDFFYNILKAFKKVYKSEEISWRHIVKKFREYLK